MNAIFLHCRAGFEAECAAELMQRALALEVSGYCKAKPDAAYVSFHAHGEGGAARVMAGVQLDDLVFARDWFLLLDLRNDLPLNDRVGPIVEVAASGPAYGDLVLEYLDTNTGKQLSSLCRGIEAPLRKALKARGLLAGGLRAPRLHACFLSVHAAAIGWAAVDNSAPWPMGIPRLRFPAAAPSRSTLKLEEAFLRFLGAEGVARDLQSGMTAVDLGAAPGGWTWQLVRRQLRVVAVDNGPMDAALMESGLVEHRREDGFRYQPPQPVEWLVCDMVEQPSRIAQLVARWFVHGWCRQAIFNLKLPMKKRYEEVRHCLDLIDTALREHGIDYRLQAKQLYHDREEVTVYLRRTDGKQSS